MVDVEQVLNLLSANEMIKEPSNPIESKIKGAEIEFKDVSFTYDAKLPENEQTIVIDKLSFKVEAG